MSKTIIDGLTGLKAFEGKEVGVSSWQTLSFSDIQRFAEATGDHQWIHVDRDRIARESPFGAPVAHGYYSLSRIAGLFFEVVDIQGFTFVLNYGLNKVRFPAPLKEGARYRLSLKVGGLKEIDGGVEATLLAAIEIENQPKPACAAEVVYRLLA